MSQEHQTDTATAHTEQANHNQEKRFSAEGKGEVIQSHLGEAEAEKTPLC